MKLKNCARYSVLTAACAVAVSSTVLSCTRSPRWWALATPTLGLAGLGAYDLLQRRHAILRNYPLLGHARYLLEEVRPEVQQYFVERNFDGRPYDRVVRNAVYQRSKGVGGKLAFGTERDVYEHGHEFLAPSFAPRPVPQEPPTVRVGGPECAQPYNMSLLNVSAMSFGALSANAVLALNKGAQAGGFAHDTGEGGISKYHLRHGGDLIWEIGTGYFGCRTAEGDFDPEAFEAKALHPNVKCVLLKLSQGAKPGMGGVLPGSKVDAEIAHIRGVQQGRTVASPPHHRAFTTPRELVRFLASLRSLAGGKPVGVKFCVGARTDVLALCKAMLTEGTGPDFIVVDGAEGGTGAAPPEFADRIGMPLTEGLMTVHNSLVGVGLRDRIRIGASGKIATGADIVTRLAQGADFTNAARTMMFALGCIQAQACHTNECPVGVATQDPGRARALDVDDKAERVRRYQASTVGSAQQIMAAMGLDEPAQLHPRMLHRRATDSGEIRSYAELHAWLGDKELLDDPPAEWCADWNAADPDSFAV
ncbi:FMN-binding glutamate synthase family protein [Streptomyces hydrogenans]|uniref:FMN-binding glutamate synthase family protein n=1 Tax=Streptomyces hydrogenans TaxID=1873719 RepID=A0ABQ3PQH3_9ACTN|nr:FMN-binding glutamate synthase family protein [Streptomyces hydrogenans]GHE25505.1 FMN-binding glutamate synthase family protein [Streptomyces hydrogenans]GHI27244.1 FMN-binding glutamate synthase family protein [Streptomyces hydrogenans]